MKHQVQAAAAPHIDPLSALAEIEEVAARALRSLAAGEATTGVSYLTKVKHMASDARRWAPPSAAGSTMAV